MPKTTFGGTRSREQCSTDRRLICPVWTRRRPDAVRGGRNRVRPGVIDSRQTCENADFGAGWAAGVAVLSQPRTNTRAADLAVIRRSSSLISKSNQLGSASAL
ncbi:hypothetical protein [Saccharopolyspora thermophila]|uniref:hypothetical protein n=1 Tax=Saccharopolyspora thermophila TaxID=89367 RepID=UPI0031F7C434